MARTVEIEHRHQRPKGSRALETWLRIGRNVLRVAVIGLILSLIYILYGLMSGEYGKFPNAVDHAGLLTQQEQVAMVTTLQRALLVFIICGWIASLLGLALFWGTEVPTALVGLTGLLFYMGIPMLVTAVLNRQGFSYALEPNQLTGSILTAAQVVGKVAMILALIRVVGVGLFSVAVRPVRGRKRAPAAKPVDRETARARRPAHLIRRCWEMAFCSDALREFCPSYKTHTPCWKRRTGCQCDPYFAIKVLEPVERARGVALSEDDESARAHIRNNPAWHAKQHATKETCRQCAIYVEHQHYKYRALFWLAYPAAAGAVFMALGVVHRAYEWAEVTLTKMIHGVAVLPQTRPELEPFINTVVAADVEVVVVAAVALLIVTSIVRLFEWAIFEQML